VGGVRATALRVGPDHVLRIHGASDSGSATFRRVAALSARRGVYAIWRAPTTLLGCACGWRGVAQVGPGRVWQAGGKQDGGFGRNVSDCGNWQPVADIGPVLPFWNGRSASRDGRHYISVSGSNCDCFASPKTSVAVHNPSHSSSGRFAIGAL